LKFVSLHNHTGYSIYDAIGTPADYVEWVLENAGDDSRALAITEHGNMNSIGYIAAAQEKYEGRAKLIFGNEAYYIPSIETWEQDKERATLTNKEKKRKKKEKDSLIEDEKESKNKSYDPVNRRNHLVILAQNQKGLENLFRLTSRSYRQGFYRKPRVDFNMLKACNEGLIISSACLAGLPAYASFHPDVGEDEVKRDLMYHKELDPLMELFGKDRFFLELQFNNIPEQQILNEHIMDFSEKTGYKMIVTCDSHYPRPEMWRDRKIYNLLGYQAQKKNIDVEALEREEKEADTHLYLKNAEQLLNSLYDSPFGKNMGEAKERRIKEAIERTYDIAHDLIEDVHTDRTIKLPKVFQVTEDIKTPFEKLKKLSFQGLKDKGLLNKEYMDRTAFELGAIKKLGMEEYFLAKKEIIDTHKRHMLIGTARGSAGGSLVCYLIGITMIDSVKHNLLFERFLSTSRADLADIDTDIEMKEYSMDILKERFGKDNVLAISNYNRLQLRSLIKDISKLYSVPYEEVNQVTKVIENEAKDRIMEEIGHDQKLYEFTFDRAVKYSPTLRKFLKAYPKVGKHISNLFQEIKATSIHAGGVLITDDIEKHVPVVVAKGLDQCPVSEGITAQHLKYLGMVKFDVLGLTTLKIIRRCIEGILKEGGAKRPTMDDVWEFYNENLHPDVIDQGSKEVFKKVYCGGSFPSVFQFSQPAVRSFCRKAKPKTVSDISAITSIFRPGPLEGRAHERYLAFKPSDLKKEHPIIQEVLKDTRGTLVYQEQFMVLANRLAGFSLEEANKLRKLLMKPMVTLADEIKKERIEIGERFVNGCMEKGLTKRRANKLWEKEILGFISYGFNKCLLFSETVIVFDSCFMQKEMTMEQIYKNKDKMLFVGTRDEETQKDVEVFIKDVHDTGIKDVFEFNLQDGKIVRCTQDHKFRTTDGELLPICQIMAGSLGAISCKYLGKKQTYDLEVNHPDHQFYMANGVLTSNSHAIAYSYDSYQCAWLYTHHEKNWLKACLECDSNLEKTINAVRFLGYPVEKPDVNKSTDIEWDLAEDGSFVPPLVSLKGIGLTAAGELVKFRPSEGFKDIYDFLFKNGGWRWNKLNKKGLQILVRIEAFESLGCVGKEKLFKNYSHMERSIFGDNFDKIKKGKLTLEDAAAMAPKDDWSVVEKIGIQKGIVGFYDKTLIVGEFLEVFKEFSIKSIDETPDDKHKLKVWAIVEKVDQKISKNGNPFVTVSVTGSTDKPYFFRVWNTTVKGTDLWIEGNVVIFGLDYSKKWGFNLSNKVRPMQVTK